MFILSEPRKCPFHTLIRGKLGKKLFVQSFYRPKTQTSFNRQFSPKSPKIGKKSGQRVQNSQNKDPTVNSVLRPTVGIHQFCPPSYCGNPFIYSSGFPQQLGGQNWWIPTVGRRTELMDSHSRSDATWSLFGEFRTLWPDF